MSSSTKSSTRFAIIRYDEYWAVHDREIGLYAVTPTKESAMRLIMDVTMNPSNVNCWVWSNDPPKRSSSIKDMFAP